MIVIADSSALVALSLCQSLQLLDRLFGDIFVPKSVYEEVIFKGKPEAEALDEYLQMKVKSVSMENYPVQNTANLGRGEL